MNNPLTNLKQEAQKIRLSSAEKNAMRARVMDFVHGTTAVEQARLVKSPFYFFPQYAGAFAALLIVVGGGAAYAAQNALPGSVLYSLKTNVTEPAQGVFALSTDSKVQFHADVAATRLEEAETLASQGDLDSAKSAQLASGLNAQIEQMNNLNQTLAQSDADAATENSTQFDAALSAHSAILAHLGDNSQNQATRENSGTLATIAGSVSAPVMHTFAAAAVVPMQAKMATTGVTSAGVSTMAAMAPEATSSATTSDQESHKGQKGYGGSNNKSDTSIQKKAQSAVSNLESQFDSLKATLDAQTAVQVEAQIDAIKTQLNNGDAVDALGASTKLSTFISASKRFDHGILNHLLDGTDGDE